ncbi:hypothetical protein BJ878DRAFT_483221 [Calycina marina]|uniref:Uncharacterized protein n=1 Tax=Calycina marina TaxID=1763456 RepID=A0A9P7YWP4_9HELO|nr:hypothetical protein BJ878DRAFT_483221 [Calycina marina]
MTHRAPTRRFDRCKSWPHDTARAVLDKSLSHRITREIQEREKLNVIDKWYTVCGVGTWLAAYSARGYREYGIIPELSQWLSSFNGVGLVGPRTYLAHSVIYIAILVFCYEYRKQALHGIGIGRQHTCHPTTSHYSTHLLTHLLRPLLENAAVAAAGIKAGAVRVVWACSQVVDLQTPDLRRFTSAVKDLEGLERKSHCLNSKIGNWFLAERVCTQTHGPSEHPKYSSAQIRSDTTHVHPLLHPAIKGTYTELWAGLSPDLGMQHAARIPWGRVHLAPRAEPGSAMKGPDADEEGSGFAGESWE